MTGKQRGIGVTARRDVRPRAMVRLRHGPPGPGARRVPRSLLTSALSGAVARSDALGDRPPGTVALGCRGTPPGSMRPRPVRQGLKSPPTIRADGVCRSARPVFSERPAHFKASLRQFCRDALHACDDRYCVSMIETRELEATAKGGN